jgi:8-oxo-dGTP pyrophosphatase MutT (NUDIX family)
VFPDSGLIGNAVGVVHGQVAEAPDELRLDEVEDLRWVPVRDLPRLIATGVLRDGITLSALAIWMSRRDADTGSVRGDGDH